MNITTLERTAIAAIAMSMLPPLGQPLEGGIFAGITTRADGVHVAVVLLADKPEADQCWMDALAWAEKVGGELPSRPVAALLFANLKAHFDPRWHWTAEEYSASCAWFCYFDDGYQLNDHKSYEAAARAVRMIPIKA